MANLINRKQLKEFFSKSDPIRDKLEPEYEYSDIKDTKMLQYFIFKETLTAEWNNSVYNFNILFPAGYFLGYYLRNIVFRLIYGNTALPTWDIFLSVGLSSSFGLFVYGAVNVIYFVSKWNQISPTESPNRVIEILTPNKIKDIYEVILI